MQCSCILFLIFYIPLCTCTAGLRCSVVSCLCVLERCFIFPISHHVCAHFYASSCLATDSWMLWCLCMHVHYMKYNYMKYNVYLCLGVLCRVFSPLCVCICLSEPLTGLPWIWWIIFNTLWLSKYWDIMYITYITKTKFLPVQNKFGFFASAILVCLHKTQLHNV